jgi:pimeloyl-ACP methyl ester carboxylesterase
MKLTRVFIHGLESSGGGTKGVFFRQRYPDMIIEDYTGSFPERMDKLEGLLAGKGDLILIGSSFGGLMAAVYACLHAEEVKRLILLSPALHLTDYGPCLGRKLLMPVTIIHGRMDTIVPLEEVRGAAERVFRNLTFTVVEDDHVLHRTFPILDWEAFLNFPDRPAGS